MLTCTLIILNILKYYNIKVLYILYLFHFCYKVCFIKVLRPPFILTSIQSCISQKGNRRIKHTDGLKKYLILQKPDGLLFTAQNLDA